MLRTISLLLLLLCGVYTTPTSAQSEHRHEEHMLSQNETCTQPPQKNRKPGDYGYKHCEFHPAYQALYAKGKCYCHKGGCRPSKIRTNAASETGMEVLVSGVWREVKKEYLINPKELDPETLSLLFREGVHVCAVGTIDEKTQWPIDVERLECVITLGGI